MERLAGPGPGGGGGSWLWYTASEQVGGWGGGGWFGVHCHCHTAPPDSFVTLFRKHVALSRIITDGFVHPPDLLPFLLRNQTVVSYKK